MPVEKSSHRLRSRKKHTNLEWLRCSAVAAVAVVAFVAVADEVVAADIVNVAVVAADEVVVVDIFNVAEFMGCASTLAVEKVGAF